jgi:hypothetical protein
MSEPPIALDDDAQRIIQAYETNNEELRARVKELERQLSSGEPNLKSENQALRRKIFELQTQNEAAENYDRLQEEHVRFVREAKEREMNLHEQLSILELENAQLREQCGQWNTDDTQNETILTALNSLREATVRGKGVEEALDSFTAMIAPEILVRREHELHSRGRQQRGSSRLMPEGGRRQQQEIEALREEVEALKAKLNAPRQTRLPGPRVNVGSSKDAQRVKELEEKVAELEQRCEESQRVSAGLKARAKERAGKVKEMTDELQAARDEVAEVKRKHQIELAEQTIEKATIEAQLKALQTNADYKIEYEKIRAKAVVLEAENTELKRPRPTGAAALDRVLDELAKMEGGLQQRQSDLSRMVVQLEDKFEAEKREIEVNHRREIDEKNHQLRRLKVEFESILADLEQTKKKR